MLGLFRVTFGSVTDDESISDYTVLVNIIGIHFTILSVYKSFPLTYNNTLYMDILVALFPLVRERSVVQSHSAAP